MGGVKKIQFFILDQELEVFHKVYKDALNEQTELYKRISVLYNLNFQKLFLDKNKSKI